MRWFSATQSDRPHVGYVRQRRTRGRSSAVVASEPPHARHISSTVTGFVVRAPTGRSPAVLPNDNGGGRAAAAGREHDAPMARPTASDGSTVACALKQCAQHKLAHYRKTREPIGPRVSSSVACVLPARRRRRQLRTDGENQGTITDVAGRTADDDGLAKGNRQAGRDDTGP